MKKNGSITVFSALAFMLVASFLFALLEAGRQYCLQVYADMCTSLAIESVCAEYHPKLWQDYHLLGLDGAYGSETFSVDQVAGVFGARVRANTVQEEAGSTRMELKLETAYPDGYQLLTDGDGQVFLHCVSALMMKNLPMEAARILYGRYMEGTELEDNGQAAGSVEAAQSALQEAQAQRAAEGQGKEAQHDQDAEAETESGQEGVQGAVGAEENPLELVLAAKQRALLGMVVEDLGSLSTAAIRSAEMLENRVCREGTMNAVPEVDWYEKVLTLEYLGNYFGDYHAPAEGHALAYELEYVLCGEETDRDNLERVAERLLLMREAANVVHIVSDSEKCSLAMALASALAGFTGNPAIVKVVQLGIIAAWAYAESILDLRALLSGDRIAPLKSREQWTSQLGSLTQIFAGEGKAKSCPDGISYRDYLKGFLFMLKEQSLASRMMGIMEQNIRQDPIYRNCRMDHMLCAFSWETYYTAQPLFWNLSVLRQQELPGLQFGVKKSFSYY